MKTADCSLKLNSTIEIRVTGVTPAEAVYLTSAHKKLAKGPPLTIVEESEVERDDDEELRRLRRKYGMGHIEVLFPGVSPRLPESFERAVEAGMRVSLPSNRQQFGREPELHVAKTGDE